MTAMPEIAATIVFVVGLTTALVCWLARGGAAQDSGLSVLDEDPTDDLDLLVVERPLGTIDAALAQTTDPAQRDALLDDRLRAMGGAQ